MNEHYSIMFNKKGTWAMWVSIILVAILIIGIFLYFSLFNPRHSANYETSLQEPVNPALELSQEEAIAVFNESFVYYVLYVIKAYNLHNPPLSSDTPKISFFVDQDAYNAEIINGNILINRGEISGGDIIISTSKEDAVKIMKDPNYVRESYRNGSSKIELMAGKATLFAKGYLNLYKEVTGKSITGSVVRIYVD